MADEFNNYTPPYIYVLMLISKTGCNPLVGIRVASCVMDYVCALGIGLIGERWRRGSLLTAMTIVPALPTLLMNSCYWGQCDAFYASAIVFALYFLQEERPWASALMLGTAFAFKLQTIFVLPLYFILLMQREGAGLRHLMVAPLPYLVGIAPEWIAGRDLTQLLTIYAGQGGQYDALTLQCPNIYSLIEIAGPLPTEASQAVKLTGMALVVILTAMAGVMMRRRATERNEIVPMALTSVLCVVMLLPCMHERYLFVADVMAVAIYLMRRTKTLPALVIATSLYAYMMCTRVGAYLPTYIGFIPFAMAIALSIKQLTTNKTDKI